MGDAESVLPSSKKRVAGRQISKDNPELDDEGPEMETGTFKKASEEVLAARRIVKVRRSQQPAATSSNPFAAIRLVPPSVQPDTPGDKTVEKRQDDANDKNEASGAGDGGNESGTTDTKLEDKIDLSTVKNDDRVKSDAVEQSSQTGEEIGNGEKDTERVAREETGKDDKGVTKQDAEEETEKELGEETEKEKLENDKKGTTEKVTGGETESVAGEETEKEKLENEKTDTAKPVASLSSFRQMSSSQNAFTGVAGTGFGTSSFSFGSLSKDGATFGGSSGSMFAFNGENPLQPSFGAGSSNGGKFSFQSSSASATDLTKNGTGGVPSMQEVPTETGEENETAVFSADAVLYEYLDGGWKERGKGELKVNTSVSGADKARLVMRARGNYRLILNASLYPDMTLASMDKKGITFACVNSAGEGKGGLTTFALKFRDVSFVEEFRAAVTEHKGKKVTVLKTPENSPKASDE